MNSTVNRLVRKASIEEAPLNDELMLFDPSSSSFYVLNRTMTFTWRQIEKGRSVDEIAETMLHEFNGCDPGDARSDVRKAVDDLIALGLLTDTTNG